MTEWLLQKRIWRDVSQYPSKEFFSIRLNAGSFYQFKVAKFLSVFTCSIRFFAFTLLMFLALTICSLYCVALQWICLCLIYPDGVVLRQFSSNFWTWFWNLVSNISFCFSVASQRTYCFLNCWSNIAGNFRSKLIFRCKWSIWMTKFVYKLSSEKREVNFC